MSPVTITPVFVDTIPVILEENIVYISEKYHVSVHNCLCGCGIKTVLPLNHEGQNKEWNLIKNVDGTISFTPSVGNWSGEKPYHAHYVITNNVATFC